MNEQSSRSHFVFTLRISGVNEVRSCFGIAKHHANLFVLVILL